MRHRPWSRPLRNPRRKRETVDRKMNRCSPGKLRDRRGPWGEKSSLASRSGRAPSARGTRKKLAGPGRAGACRCRRRILHGPVRFEQQIRGVNFITAQRPGIALGCKHGQFEFRARTASFSAGCEAASARTSTAHGSDADPQSRPRERRWKADRVDLSGPVGFHWRVRGGIREG